MKKKRLVDIEISRNRQDIVNLAANLLSFAVSLVISFFLSPYIVKNLGAEANGFVTLAGNFTSYASLVKTALNSIGSRYIILAYHKNDYKTANKYYSSLFYGDFFLSVIFAILAVGCVWKLDNLINISETMVTDVKILFALIFMNFIFSTATTVFSSAPYIKNKIYLQSIRDIQCVLIRALLLVVLFALFEPKVYFLGIATLVPGIVLILYNIYYKMVLVPELKVERTLFSWSAIGELVSQGMWNSISSVGTMFLTSLDLLITNLLISEHDMGVLSVAKSMPGVVAGVGSSMASVFFSAMMIDYSKGDMDVLTQTVKRSTMLVGAIVTIPLAFLLAYGTEFYSLWQPTMDANQLQILSALTVGGYILYAGANSVGTIFTVTLHVKESAISVFVSGLISFVITMGLVKYTDLGIYAVAGVSSVVTTIRMICYTIPMGAVYIGKKPMTFIPVVLKSLVSTMILFFEGYLLKLVIAPVSWTTLIISAVLFGFVALGTNMIIVMDNEARTEFISLIKTKLKKKN